MPSTYSIRVSDIMPQAPSLFAIEAARTRFPMFGSKPAGATIIIRTFNTHYALQYEGWEEYVWLEDALRRQRSTLRHKPLEVALRQYESEAAQVAA